MAVLMDTHVVLWMAYRPERLSATAKRLLLEESNVVYSIVSLWEIGLKLSRAGYDLEIPGKWHLALPGGLSGQGIGCLAISPDHCRAVQTLPFHHKDPFDRMLIAQARVEGLAILTRDAHFQSCGVEVVW
jgi:PIN domain nuclease of toxin-antitoxin system